MTAGLPSADHVHIAVVQASGISGRHPMQTNFAGMLWKVTKVYNAERQYGEHQREVRYELPVPRHRKMAPRGDLYIHTRPVRQHG